jgi:holliday junction DNA helicase RuvA
VGGVGYEVDVPMSTFFNLPALGERVVLLTHFVVREDAQVLFGFLTAPERATFRELVKISGVGPRTALSILSGLSVAELAQAVSVQDGAAWSRCRASARRPPSGCCSSSRASSAPTWRCRPRPRWSDAQADIVQALVALGYNEVAQAKAQAAR